MPAIVISFYASSGSVRQNKNRWFEKKSWFFISQISNLKEALYDVIMADWNAIFDPKWFDTFLENFTKTANLDSFL